MKDPGPVIAGTEYHYAISEYARAMAKHFDIAVPAALGQLLKFDDAIRRVTKNPMGMSSLVIEVKDETGSEPPVGEKK